VNNRQFNVERSVLDVQQFWNHSQFTTDFDPNECLVQDGTVGRWQSASINNAKGKRQKILGVLRFYQPMAERDCNQCKKSRAHYVSNIAASSVLHQLARVIVLSSH
jgi:hypothetical protein